MERAGHNERNRGRLVVGTGRLQGVVFFKTRRKNGERVVRIVGWSMGIFGRSFEGGLAIVVFVSAECERKASCRSRRAASNWDRW